MPNARDPMDRSTTLAAPARAEEAEAAGAERPGRGVRAAADRRLALEERVRPHRDQVRRELRRAATLHLLDVGYRAAKLDTIAKNAGYTKGAIYSNFASKQGLFLDILTERMGAFAAASDASIDAATSIDEVVVVLSARLAREIIDETAWHVLVVEFATEAVKDPDTAARYAALRAERRDAIASQLQQKRADIPDGTARAATSALLASVNGLALEIAADRAAFTEQQVAAALRATLSLFLTPGTTPGGGH